MKELRRDIEVIKGIAIIAVVFFHLGVLKSGYLGVDAFFVINGFFLIPPLYKNISEGHFSFWGFLKKRILRLLPLIVVASIICIIVGYIGMLPDDYENLCQTIVASNLFSQNILSELTVSNYWSSVNDFKPLMHLWYVGILVEFYIIIPLILLGVASLCYIFRWNKKQMMKSMLLLLFLTSIILFVLPLYSYSEKFYLIPFRLFELIGGGLFALYMPKQNIHFTNRRIVSVVVFSLLVFVICSSLVLFNANTLDNTPVIVGSDRQHDDGLIFSRECLLLLTVLFSIIYVNIGGNSIKNSFFEWLGKRSYSIFIWHQVILAFGRYYYTTDITLLNVSLFIFITLVVSELSYRLVEKNVRVNTRTFLLWSGFALLCIIISWHIYMRAGVVRDVPELGITEGEGERGMFSNYCDRIYSYNKDFPDNNGKTNVLVEGISYGRDFCNILLESSLQDEINLSYVEKWEFGDYHERIKEADVVFTFRSKTSVPEYVWETIGDTSKIFGLGPKAYGINNGQIYSHRRTTDYYSMTVNALPECIELNREWREQWGANYIDFMTPVLEKDNRIRIFTPDHKFISQDCRHLTPFGAKWYASVLNLEKHIKGKE